MSLTFHISARSSQCAARVGRVETPHGAFDTPAFMPVGTQGTIKGLLPGSVADTGAQVILANTFHLMLRPGSELVAELGGADGLHEWMRWPGPILTDSGGFQVFSLADISTIDDAGVTFRSPHDGRYVQLTPQLSMQVQNELGADIIMAFDDCPPLQSAVHSPQSAVGEKKSAVHGAQSAVDEEDEGNNQEPGDPWTGDHARIVQACERSLRWLELCVEAHQRKSDQALFGIVQGGTDLELRARCAERVVQHDLPGFAIGGVAVGEGFEEIRRVVEHTAPLLPVDKPRYLMGVGYERDILAAVRAGVDMFDCVLPTRNGRNANAFTRRGQMRLRNSRFLKDPRPIDDTCDCPACAGGFSRSYIRHLFHADEMLGPILVSLHNLRHFQRYMLDIRRAIAEDDWSLIHQHWPVATERLTHPED